MPHLTEAERVADEILASPEGERRQALILVLQASIELRDAVLGLKSSDGAGKPITPTKESTCGGFEPSDEAFALRSRRILGE